MEKLISSLLVLVLLSQFSACNNDDTDSPNPTDTAILGKWKLTAAYISSGGPQYWVDVEDGEEIEFLSEGSFTSTNYPECKEDGYTLDGENLVLDYDCEDMELVAENEDGLITFHIEFEDGHFLLSPTSVLCIEGCSYKYERMD